MDTDASVFASLGLSAVDQTVDTERLLQTLDEGAETSADVASATATATLAPLSTSTHPQINFLSSPPLPKNTLGNMFARMEMRNPSRAESVASSFTYGTIGFGSATRRAGEFSAASR